MTFIKSEELYRKKNPPVGAGGLKIYKWMCYALFVFFTFICLTGAFCDVICCASFAAS